jgi:hypothetical protein
MLTSHDRDMQARQALGARSGRRRDRTTMGAKVQKATDGNRQTIEPGLILRYEFVMVRTRGQ